MAGQKAENLFKLNLNIHPFIGFGKGVFSLHRNWTYNKMIYLTCFLNGDD